MMKAQNYSMSEKPAWAIRAKEILYDQGRNQVWLARKLGMDSTQLRHIFNGDSRYKVTDALIQQIADLLDVPISTLKGTTTNPQA